MKIIAFLQQPVSTQIRLRKDRNPTVTLLFGVAALQTLIAAVGWFAHKTDADVEELRWFLYSYDRIQFNWLDWAFMLSGIIYAALAVAALRARLAAALCGAGLYGVFLLLHASHTVRPMAGLFTKIVAAILLLMAVAFAAARMIHSKESQK